MVSILVNLIKGNRGTISAELAIVIPALLLILMVPLIFNLAIWAKIVVTDSSREGARYEALNLGEPQYIVHQTLIDGNLNPDYLEQINTSEGSGYVSVQVKYSQPSIVPGLGVLFGGNLFDDTIPLSSTSVFKVEQ